MPKLARFTMSAQVLITRPSGHFGLFDWKSEAQKSLSGSMMSFHCFVYNFSRRIFKFPEVFVCFEISKISFSSCLANCRGEAFLHFCLIKPEIIFDSIFFPSTGKMIFVFLFELQPPFCKEIAVP
jgi:hypothetical protein